MDNDIVLNFFLANQREIYARVNTYYYNSISTTEQPMTRVGVEEAS